MDEKQGELEWEARAARPAAAAAFTAATFVIGGIGYSVAALPRGATKADRYLVDLHNHSGAFLGAAIISSLGMLLLIPVLQYLYRVTKFRRPELPSIARILAIAGPLAFAILQIVFHFQQVDAASQFVAGTIKTTKHAEDLIRNQTNLVAGLSLAARVAIGFSFILISLNAMRAGLMSRFMGILGVILGALYVLPLVAAPLIQLFWLGALGMLFLGKWPGGERGPAWDAGEALEWPAPQRRMAAQQARARDSDAVAEDSQSEAEPDAERSPSARSRKRKKKR
jgi:hypothetical protein